MGRLTLARATNPAAPVAVRGLDGVVQRRPLPATAHRALFARLVLSGAEPGEWLHVWAARRRTDGRLLARRRDPLTFRRAEEIEALLRQAGVWHGRGLEVFAGMLPRTRPEPVKAAVGEGSVVWADVDDLDALPRLRSFCADRPPHYVAVSGSSGGRHVAWLLAGRHGARELEAANRTLAQAVGGDVAVCHAGASLRLPGTRNGKPGGGWCRILAADLARAPYDPSALVAGLAPMDHTPPGVSTTAGERRVVRWPADRLAAVAPPAYFAALCGVSVPVQGGTVRCPLPGHEDEHPSCMVYPTAAQGWRCFSHPGGPIGGRIYDLASALHCGPTGRGLRGPAFRAARARADRACRAAPMTAPGRT
jgi:RepB DNA-primase from phage plasmid